jgi:hypothetical protein
MFIAIGGCVKTYKGVILSPFLKKMIRNRGDDYGVKLERHTTDLLRVLASRGRDYVSQYPAQRPLNLKRPHWRRGIGMVYIKKRGGVSIYERSQVLFARWAISQFPTQVVLYNTATYSGLVHREDIQRFAHMGLWKTDANMIQHLRKEMRTIIPGGIMSVVRAL